MLEVFSHCEYDPKGCQLQPQHCLYVEVVVGQLLLKPPEDISSREYTKWDVSIKEQKKSLKYRLILLHVSAEITF